MKIIKKFLALPLAVLMILSVFPVMTSAAVTDKAETNANPIDIEVFDLKAEDNLQFSYTVTFDDGTTKIKSSNEADSNLSVSQNQNTATVSYGTVKTQVAVPYSAEEDFGYYTSNNKVYIYNVFTDAKTVEIPSSINGKTVVGIDSYAFISHPATTVKIPYSVTYIGENTFAESNVKSITVSSKNKSLASKDGIVYNKKMTKVVAVPPAKTGEVTLPYTVSNIDVLVNYDAKFTVSISSKSSYFTQKNGVIYNKKKTKLLYAPKTLSGTFTLPSTVTSIGNSAFANCTKLKSVKISSKVTSISYGAFKNCVSLTTVNLPKKLKSINKYAFAETVKLKSIKLPSKLKTINDGAFQLAGLTSVSIPDSVNTIGEYAFFSCGSLKTINLGKGIKTIKNSAFEMSAITTVNVPNSVTELGYYTFSNCKNLKRAVLPNKLKRIGYGVFYQSGNLVSVKIPKSVKLISGGAFEGCEKLQNVYYTGTKTQWNKIEIEEWGNDLIKNAKKHYNYKYCNSHIYDNSTDFTCNRCGYVLSGAVVRKVGSKWYYFKNCKKVKLYTGMHKVGGKQKYIKNGVITANLDQPNVKLTNTSKGVKVSWKKVNSATSYKVYRSTYKNGKWSEYKLYKTTASLSYVDKNVTNKDRVRYTVYAHNKTHKSKYKTGKIITVKK